MEIFKLFGSILVDSSKAEDSISKTEKKGQGLGKTLGGMIGTAAKWAAGLGAGAVAVGGAMFGMATKAGNAADRILDLKAITGMSTNEIQRWERVSKIAGTSVDSMTNASQRLTKSLDTMAREGGKGNEALEAIGLSFEEISNMNADERMNAITKALSDIDDPTKRAKIGTDLLGGSWKEIAPIVDMGAEAMEKAKASANIISEDDLEKANKFRISVAEMRDQASHFGMTLAIGVIPIMQRFMDWVQQYMPKIQEIMGKAFEFISVVVDQAVDMFQKFLFPVFQSMKDWVVENLPAIQEFFQVAFQYIQGIIQSFVNIATFLWNFYGDYIIKQTRVIFDVVKNVLQGAMSIIRGILDFFIGLFTGDWSRMGEGLKRIWNGLWQAISSILRGSWGLLSNAFGFIRDKISGWFTNLKGNALQWGKNMIQGFIDGIFSMGSKVADAASNVVKKAADFLKFWSPAKKGEGRFIRHWGRNMIDGFIDGVEDMEPEAQAAMNSVVGSMKPDSSTNIINSVNSNNSNVEGLLVELIQAVKEGKNLNIDGKTFAKVTGDYTDEEGGNRIRLIERGLAT